MILLYRRGEKYIANKLFLIYHFTRYFFIVFIHRKYQSINQIMDCNKIRQCTITSHNNRSFNWEKDRWPAPFFLFSNNEFITIERKTHSSLVDRHILHIQTNKWWMICSLPNIKFTRRETIIHDCQSHYHDYYYAKIFKIDAMANHQSVGL